MMPLLLQWLTTCSRKRTWSHLRMGEPMGRKDMQWHAVMRWLMHPWFSFQVCLLQPKEGYRQGFRGD